MKVCIAEKPSVAKEIAHVIGAKQRNDGYFEGNGYQVTWTFGHLCTLKEPDDYFPELKKWNLNYLPIIPTTFGIKLIDDSGVAKQFKTIEKLIKNATEVINCGDAGQEGEVIQRWVLSKANCKAPTKRLWISSLTEDAIRSGFKKLYDAKDFDLLYAAGSARAIGDWLLGINATRLYTLKYGGFGQVLSIGRVQTPTLALVVQRQLEIDNFKPEPYWEIKTLYKDVVFNCTKGRFKKKEEAQQLVENIKNHPFTVTSFTKKKGKELPPKLFDLTSLQVECNKKFGLTAEQTLKVIQNLYERKLVTYPRVDTTFLPNDIYPQVTGILQSMNDYSEYVKPLLQDKIKKRPQVFNDKKVTDHHAIIPTNITARGLVADEKKVYDTIARRFLAVFYDDCQVSKTEVIGEVDKLPFKVTGKQILSEGWRVLYPRANKEQQGKNEEQVLPEFKKGETGPHKPDLLEKITKPPKFYTEATLLRSMETAGKQVDDEELQDALKENGIGRPSTRANIIETLFRRKYIRRNRKNIEATQTGLELIGKVKNDLLKSAELTGQWESKFRQIESKEYDVKDLMEEVKNMVRGIVEEVKEQKTEKIAFESEEAPKPKIKKQAPAKDKKTSCPKCRQGEIIKGKTAYGCSNFKNGCDFKVVFELFGKKLTENQLLTLISKGKTGTIKGFKQEGKSINGSLTLDENFVPYFVETQQKITKRTCPRCKQGEMIKGKAAYGCSNYAKGCKTIIPFEFLSKKLSDTQINSLINKGVTPKIKGFVQNGQKVNGKLSFDTDFKLMIQIED